MKHVRLDCDVHHSASHDGVFVHVVEQVWLDSVVPGGGFVDRVLEGGASVIVWVPDLAPIDRHDGRDIAVEQFAELAKFWETPDS